MLSGSFSCSGNLLSRSLQLRDRICAHRGFCAWRIWWGRFPRRLWWRRFHGGFGGGGWRGGGWGGWRGPAFGALGVGVGLGIASAAWGPGWGWGGPGWGYAGWDGGGCTSWRQVWTGWGWRMVPVNACW